jgi:predicted P-loop ATPase
VLDKAARNRISIWLWQIYKLKPSEGDLKMILTDLAQHERYHPVRDYFAKLVWDGKPRFDTWLHDYGGAEQTPFLSRVGAITLIAAVRRIRQPGCKFDEMPVLETPTQGTNKTSAWKVLAINDEWYVNDLPLTSDTRKVLEQSQGKLIIEAAELVGMSGNIKVINRIKGFMDRGFDTARWAYGDDVSERPRQFILVGSTNETEWLFDKTGNRRFWPISVKRFNIEELKKDRDQLWAEAAHREAQGESIRLEEKL